MQYSLKIFLLLFINFSLYPNEEEKLTKALNFFDLQIQDLSSKTAPDIINKRYKKLALQHHPDKKDGNQRSFQILSDYKDFLLTRVKQQEKQQEKQQKLEEELEKILKDLTKKEQVYKWFLNPLYNQKSENLELKKKCKEIIIKQKSQIFLNKQGKQFFDEITRNEEKALKEAASRAALTLGIIILAAKIAKHATVC